MAATEPTKTTDQTQQATQQTAQQDAARRAADQDAARRSADTSRTAAADDATRRAGDDARRASRTRFEDEKKAVADRPHETGGKPTPTQAENDEIRSGLRHIDDKEDDGSGPEPRFGMRRIDANAPGGGYETR